MRHWIKLELYKSIIEHCFCARFLIYISIKGHQIVLLLCIYEDGSWWVKPVMSQDSETEARTDMNDVTMTTDMGNWYVWNWYDSLCGKLIFYDNICGKLIQPKYIYKKSGLWSPSNVVSYNKQLWNWKRWQPLGKYAGEYWGVHVGPIYEIYSNCRTKANFACHYIYVVTVVMPITATTTIM